MLVKRHLNKKRIKKTIIKETLKGLKQILVKKGCLLLSKYYSLILKYIY
jgi:hypothetical protein